MIDKRAMVSTFGMRATPAVGGGDGSVCPCLCPLFRSSSCRCWCWCWCWCTVRKGTRITVVAAIAAGSGDGVIVADAKQPWKPYTIIVNGPRQDTNGQAGAGRQQRERCFR